MRTAVTRTHTLLFSFSSGSPVGSSYLNLPAEVIPKSLQKPAVQPKRLGGERPQREGGERPPRGEGYRARSAPSADGKATDSFTPSFVRWRDDAVVSMISRV